MYHTHLIKGGDPYSKHAAPASLRRLTIRESSRLHGFPDDFIFCGPKSAIYRQIGNSVPPILAQAIAATLRDILVSAVGA